ncbi:MAG: bifunctional SulP family inorganic anion transporter/carbonic anhydrase [Pirellulales bacterium]
MTIAESFPRTLGRDLIAGVVVFLVALPLCLGVAQASGAAPVAGMIAGIVGGIVVGLLSRSHTSVSGPAAGLTAVVAAQIESLGSYEAFLLAVVLAGAIQIALGVARAGEIAVYFPTSVIRGLLTAIGVILILKQFPHLLGFDADPEGDMAFQQPDGGNTLNSMLAAATRFHLGAAVIGLVSVALLLLWDQFKLLKQSIVPAPFIVVLIGVGLSELLKASFPQSQDWRVGASHLVQVPVAETLAGVVEFVRFPAFPRIIDPAIWIAGFTVAIVASLETLLNLEAVDKLDPQQRFSPPSRELFAQGAGNVVAGLIGGLPVTSVIVRSSVNINAGAATKRSAIIHGVLLLLCTIALPQMLNRIPLSVLAAILMVTGFKLASPKIVRAMWAEGLNRFLPYVITVAAIVFTDLLIGVVIGLVVSTAFILASNLKRPVRHIVEKHVSGEVHRFELASQLSFFNRAILDAALRKIPRGGQVLLDARNTVYVDPDVIDFIKNYRDNMAPARGVSVSLLGFQDRHQMPDSIQYVDYVSRDLQQNMTPAQVFEVLRNGNERFRENRPLTRLSRNQLAGAASGQFPMAAVLTCIDSRTPSELIFDLGMGDVFSVRIAGNIVSDRVMGSLEYACKVAGAKLVVVLGHTQCGAVTAAAQLLVDRVSAAEQTGCEHLDAVTGEIQAAIDEPTLARLARSEGDVKTAIIVEIARRNVLRVVTMLRTESSTLAQLEREDRIDFVGGLYNVSSGQIEWLVEPTAELVSSPRSSGNLRSE